MRSLALALQALRAPLCLGLCAVGQLGSLTKALGRAPCDTRNQEPWPVRRRNPGFQEASRWEVSPTQLLSLMSEEPSLLSIGEQ